MRMQQHSTSEDALGLIKLIYNREQVYVLYFFASQYLTPRNICKAFNRKVYSPNNSFDRSWCRWRCRDKSKLSGRRPARTRRRTRAGLFRMACRAGRVDCRWPACPSWTPRPRRSLRQTLVWWPCSGTDLRSHLTRAPSSC